jgi:hypothetical protein
MYSFTTDGKRTNRKVNLAGLGQVQREQRAIFRENTYIDKL